MAEYIDANGKQWQIRLTLASGLRVKDETGIDLQKIESLSEFADAAKLARMCYILAGSPSDFNSFADGVDGATIERMEAALLKEIENFSPPRKRETLKALLAKGEQIQAVAAQMATKQMTEMEPEAILKLLASGKSVTKSADTLEPIQSE